MRGVPVTAQREDERGKYILKKWDFLLWLGSPSEPGPPL